MKNKKNRIFILFCIGLIVLQAAGVCYQFILAIISSAPVASLIAPFIGLVFSSVLCLGLWAIIRSKSWGSKVFMVGVLGQLVLGIVGEYSQIMAGNMFTIVKVALSLILVWFFILVLRENIKDKRLNT